MRKPQGSSEQRRTSATMTMTLMRSRGKKRDKERCNLLSQLLQKIAVGLRVEWDRCAPGGVPGPVTGAVGAVGVAAGPHATVATTPPTLTRCRMRRARRGVRSCILCQQSPSNGRNEDRRPTLGLVALATRAGRSAGIRRLSPADYCQTGGITQVNNRRGTRTTRRADPSSQDATPSPGGIQFGNVPGLILERLESPGQVG